MKSRILSLLLVVTFLGATTLPTSAFDDYSPEAMAADGLVVRPVCFAATVVGSAIFVVILPFTLIAGKVKQTASSLIGKPARATFGRDMGDMSEMWIVE
jgi:hypothetical protein